MLIYVVKSFESHLKFILILYSTTRWWCYFCNSDVSAYQRYCHLIGQKVGEACSSADQSLLTEKRG